MRNNQNITKIFVLFAYAFFAIGVLAAYSNPALNYELSLYNSTPLVFWISVTVALVMSVFIALLSSSCRKVSLLLGGLASITVIALPIIRNYHFVGEQDSLTHLGISKDLKLGADPWNVFYPVSHTLSTYISEVSNITLERSMLLVNLSFSILFVIFIPLITRKIIYKRKAVDISLFSTFLYLPINWFGIQFAPNQHARLFLPFALFIVILTIKSKDSIRPFVIYSLMITSFLFLHGQVLLSFLSILLGISIAYSAVTHSVANGFDLLKNTFSRIILLAGIIWYTWINIQDQFITAVWRFFQSLINSSTPGESSISLVDSLQYAGGSLPEVFLKMFIQPFMFISLSMLAVLIS